MVEVTDSLGNKATATVSIGAGLTYAPADPVTSTGGAIAFQAFGGSGIYTWSLAAAPSGGTIDDSGRYVAGAVGDVVDVVTLNDALGAAVTIRVVVGAGLRLAPGVASTVLGGTVSFSAAGGSGVYAYALESNQSRGAIDESGTYTAGGRAGVDIVRLTDSFGNTARATVTVSAGGGGATNPDDDRAGVSARGLNLGGGGQADNCNCHAAGAPQRPAERAPLALASVALVLMTRRRSRRSA